MLSGYGSGMSSYLPTHEHIAFLMDLMEVALNVHGLIELCIQVRHWDFSHYVCDSSSILCDYYERYLINIEGGVTLADFWKGLLSE